MFLEKKKQRKKLISFVPLSQQPSEKSDEEILMPKERCILTTRTKSTRYNIYREFSKCCLHVHLINAKLILYA